MYTYFARYWSRYIHLLPAAFRKSSFHLVVANIANDDLTISNRDTVLIPNHSLSLSQISSTNCAFFLSSIGLLAHFERKSVSWVSQLEKSPNLVGPLNEYQMVAARYYEADTVKAEMRDLQANQPDTRPRHILRSSAISVSSIYISTQM